MAPVFRDAQSTIRGVTAPPLPWVSEPSKAPPPLDEVEVIVPVVVTAEPPPPAAPVVVVVPAAPVSRPGSGKPAPPSSSRPTSARPRPGSRPVSAATVPKATAKLSVPTATAAPAVETPVLTVASADAPGLERLWTYACPLAANRAVTRVSWNRQNADIIAVGYGALEYGQDSAGGLVCVWSAKNPAFPERVYRTSAGVTALSFATQHPHLLAVGLHDGTVAVYDVSTFSNAPVLDTRCVPYKMGRGGGG